MLVSVVIPTRDRCRTLRRTLDRLAAQNPPSGGFELVVVDDGSRDETADLLERAGERFPVPLRAISRAARGPASARNAGVAAARGGLILFLGDDMQPVGDELVARHAELHRRRHATAPYAVLGRATWHPRHEPTAFMRWLEDGGPQFAFTALAPGAVDPARYFYSAQVSLERATFEAVGGFDERFPDAAVEDTELGVRLAAAGLQLDYHPELLVLHDHATTLSASLDRMERIGRSAALYGHVHPGALHPQVRPPRPSRARLAAAASVIRPLASPPAPAAVRRWAWSALHRAAYARGYRRGPP